MPLVWKIAAVWCKRNAALPRMLWFIKNRLCFQRLSAVGNIAVAQPPISADVAAVVDAPVIIESIPVEPHDTYIDIISTTHGGRIVTTIELLSPINKAPGEGQNLYLTKQREIMRSQTHLLEIDLLRADSSTVVSGRPALPDMPRYDYIICLHRGGQGERFEIWPTSIRQRLPRIFVPLMDSDPDVVLDLQAVLNHFYDFARLADQINYALPPEATLRDEDAIWADVLLREKGLRS